VRPTMPCPDDNQRLMLATVAMRLMHIAKPTKASLPCQSSGGGYEAGSIHDKRTKRDSPLRVKIGASQHQIDIEYRGGENHVWGDCRVVSHRFVPSCLRI